MARDRGAEHGAEDGGADVRAALARLHRAQNAHDLEGFVACFDPDYESEQPAHPGRAFRGPEQVRKNWAADFAGVPDFRAELLRSVVDGDVAWCEWRGPAAGGRMEAGVGSREP